jgi:hypothetical protein
MTLLVVAAHSSMVRRKRHDISQLMTNGRRTAMNAATATRLSQRDRAVLRAVAAGRCEIADTYGGNLIVDGLWLTDQFAGPRLTGAGLIVAGTQGGPARLTESGRTLLDEAA